MSKKINKNQNEGEFFKELLESIPEDTKNYVRLSMDIASQINAMLKNENLNQRDLAERLGKKESEISKWLSGDHNFTIKSLAKIETVLGQQFLFTREEITDRFLPFLFRQFRELYNEDQYKMIVDFYCLTEKAANNISFVFPFPDKNSDFKKIESKMIEATIDQTSTIIFEDDNLPNRAA